MQCRPSNSVGEPVDLSWVFQGKFVKFVEEALYVLQNQMVGKYYQRIWVG